MLSIRSRIIQRARNIFVGPIRRDFSVADDAQELPDQIYYRMAGKRRRAHATWYRGDTTNFHPIRKSLQEPDAFEKYVGLGWLPEAPFITRRDYITAFGSCFASEVTKFLVRERYSVFGGDLGLNSYVIRAGEGIVNTAALRQQFAWAFENAAPQNSVWYTKSGVAAKPLAAIQETTRGIFQATDIFILTLGLSEVWYDKTTGDIFWQAVPKSVFDPVQHGFRTIGVEENRTNLQCVVDLIRKHRPEATIIFTLSPVPLAATFRPVSCITANSVSKASLRVAIDEVMRNNSSDKRLYYFPSYEIVTAFLANSMDDDLRHPRPKVIAFIMRAFERHFLKG